MKLLLTAFTCLLSLLAAAQNRVEYQVYYAPKMSTEGLRVEVSIRTPKAEDSTYFHFFDTVFGEPNLMRCLTGLEAPGYRFRLLPDSNRVVVYHPRGRNVRFTYRIKQDTPEYTREQFNRPRVTDTYFHVLAETLFMVPWYIAGSATPPDITANITWVGFPKDYVLHSTLGPGTPHQTYRGKLWMQFHRSLFVGGDYRIHKLNYPKRAVYVAMRGQWQHYDEPRVLGAVQQALTTQRDFWQDAGPASYTVFMSPTVTLTDSTWRGQSIKGAGLYQGFVLQSSNNPFNNWSLLRFMFNHEMMHQWIGGQIGAAHEELSKWFTEGFTDYYAYKNRLRGGELTMEQWVQSFNADVIQKLYKNVERNQPNYLIKDNYWKSPSFGKLPYHRGAVFAFWLDNQILKKSNYTRSLDDLMRQLRQDCLKPDAKFTDELFLTLAQSYLQEDLSYFFQKHILSGADLPLTTQDLMEGLAVDNSQPFPVLQITGSSASLRERYLNAKPAGKTVAKH